MFRNDPLVSFDQKPGPSPLVRTAEIAAGATTFVSAHRWMMRNRPNFAQKAYDLFLNIEDKSPGRILRTFGLSELYSSYLPQRLTIQHKDLFTGTDFSGLGEHLQRMMGTNYDLRSLPQGQELKFSRIGDGSSFMQLEGSKNVQVRFFKGTRTGVVLGPGRIASSSQRLGADLEKTPFSWLHPNTIKKAVFPNLDIKDTGPAQWLKSLSKRVGALQQPTPLYAKAIEGYYPGAVRISGKPVKNLINSAERVGFLMGERAQTLMADVRMGLWKGSYNSLFHIPFLGGKNKGLVNELLTKRALPVYLAATGLGLADYLTHHVVSDTAIDIYQKVRVAHAKLTDVVSGFRKTTDAYENVIPGSQYGPLALPLLGTTIGGLVHYSNVLRGTMDAKQRAVSARIFAKPNDEEIFLKIFNKRSPIAKGLLIGAAAMLPFIPGMLGSRKTARELQDIYSGNEPVAIRSGRWWDLGTTPWEGNRIKGFRPHWTVLHKSRAEKISLYGSEKEYWAHNPVLHPLRWLKDPYFLEKRNYEDRPYPITSPAFSNVPLVGPLLAATIGKLVKPPVRMHTEWSGDDYDIGSSRLQPKGPMALPAAEPKAEFGFRDTVNRETLAFSELIGLPGFIARTLYGNAYPDRNPGQDVFLQGSRAMESTSRRYYEKEFGAGVGPNPDLSNTLGYTEPLRRFIQPEAKRITVNEIPNTMPSWLPGEDYFLNFRTGDPYTKISEGYARLPGSGYEALHPEVTGLNPEEYPDLTKMSILGDVAPYSTEYRSLEARVGANSHEDTAERIEYEKIRYRVKQMKDSVVRTDDRVFSREVTKAKGTISGISAAGVELSEYPGRVFKMGGIGYSAADLSAIVLGEHNDWSKDQVASEVSNRQLALVDFFNHNLSPGTSVNITVPSGSLESQQDISAIFDTSGINVNKSLILAGLGQYRKDLAGPESQALFGRFGRTVGELAENISFTGDESRFNPLRYIPSPYHTKLWQERTTLSQYKQQEVEGARMRRWQHPLSDFLMPYARGVYRRVVGDPGIPGMAQKKWDLNTMSDMLEYVRDLQVAATDPSQHGRYTSQASRTAIGANLFANPTFVASTLSGRDPTYFQRFLRESDPDERRKILSSTPKEMARALSAQWISRRANIAQAEGQSVPEIGEGGRLFTEEGLQEYSKADTKLNYGDYQRSQEVAQFFAANNLALPEDAESPLYNPAIDYEDVKLKIIQQEGYDAHDFGLFDDRASLLWRKPYIDGAIRELTAGNSRSVEQMRQSVEQMILAAHDKNPKVMLAAGPASKNRNNVRVDIDIDQEKQLLDDMRRNPERFQ